MVSKDNVVEMKPTEKAEPIVDKAEQALELRKRRVSIKAISEKLGYANTGACRAAIKSCLVKRLGVAPEDREKIDVDLELEIMSLDDMEAKLWLVLEGTDPETVMKGTERMLKIKQQRQQLIERRDEMHRHPYKFKRR